MPAIVAEILQVIIALGSQLPEIVSMAESALGIVKTGTVTPEQEAAIRAQLDAMKAKIDAA